MKSKTSSFVQHHHRAQQKNQRPFIIWLTGLSASGKTTIAKSLEQVLFDREKHAYIIDGDDIRKGLCADLGYSQAARSENLRRIGELCHILIDSGLIVIVAIISPYEHDRQQIKARLADYHFIEVFVDTALDECEKRDPKGLYQKARCGEIECFTGISAPYERPKNPDVHLRYCGQSVEEHVQVITHYLEKQVLLSNVKLKDECKIQRV